MLGLFVRVCAAASLGCVLNIQWVLGGSLPSLLAEVLIEALFYGHLLVFILSPPNLLRSNSSSCLARAEQQTEKQWEETSGLVEGCVLERLHKPHFFRKPG